MIDGLSQAELAPHEAHRHYGEFSADRGADKASPAEVHTR
jgi:hypothetical protein